MKFYSILFYVLSIFLSSLFFGCASRKIEEEVRTVPIEFRDSVTPGKNDLVKLKIDLKLGTKKQFQKEFSVKQNEWFEHRENGAIFKFKVDLVQNDKFHIQTVISEIKKQKIRAKKKKGQRRPPAKIVMTEHILGSPDVTTRSKTPAEVTLKKKRKKIIYNLTIVPSI